MLLSQQLEVRVKCPVVSRPVLHMSLFVMQMNEEAGPLAQKICLLHLGLARGPALQPGYHLEAQGSLGLMQAPQNSACGPLRRGAPASLGTGCL